MKSCFVVAEQMVDCCKQNKKEVVAKLKPILKKIKGLGSLNPEELPPILIASLSKKDVKLQKQIDNMQQYLESSQVLLVTNLKNNCLSNFFLHQVFVLDKDDFKGNNNYELFFVSGTSKKL